MLVGNRIQLRGVERSDLVTLLQWLNDAGTRAQIARSGPLSMAEQERWFEALLKSTTDVAFVIETRARPRTPPRRVGTCGLHKIDWKNRNCAVGIVIGDIDDRGEGFGTDAMGCLLRHAFAELGHLGELARTHTELGLHRVELEVFPDNIAALKSYGRCGFVVEGTRRAAIFTNGGFKDLVLMSVLAPRSDAAPPPKSPKRASVTTGRT